MACFQKEVRHCTVSKELHLAARFWMQYRTLALSQETTLASIGFTPGLGKLNEYCLDYMCKHMLEIRSGMFSTGMLVPCNRQPQGNSESHSGVTKSSSNEITDLWRTVGTYGAIVPIDHL
ncbi:unnamed protein product [Fusarium graminearum]|uniref:Uncharacterized protein n=1 Tax=Gibberella zeae TaxID=5518 RepID=A0A4E9E4P2_GIBZA|nr:unnamed protein product [Fusarium graminearum]CAF3650357.1 unnamed protein product [Fusarium graminearum]CAG1962498.1 unnamed protein product [Fusarium graminearum]CAG1995666.1 unnamed protein product [Fusarium graminearum]